MKPQKVPSIYDTSARPNDRSPSLIKCLKPGSSLHQLRSVLVVRNPFHLIALSGDLEQEFLHVRIREAERDALRFFWLKGLTARKVETLRFTRALLGLSTSPFVVGCVIEQHDMETIYPEEAEEYDIAYTLVTSYQEARKKKLAI